MNNSSLKKLKQEIRNQGLRQADIARAINCDQGHISRLLSGKISADSKVLKNLCDFVFDMKSQRSYEGKIMIQSSVNECWDGSLDQAVLIADLLKTVKKISMQGEKKC